MNFVDQDMVLILARGGSKGLEDKNIRPLNGVPLLTRAIRLAQEALPDWPIRVSTDREDYAAIALEEGVSAMPLRPAGLAQDHTPMTEVVDYERSQLRPRSILLLSCTHPFVQYSSLRACANAFLEDGISRVAVGPDPIAPSWRVEFEPGRALRQTEPGPVRRRSSAKGFYVCGAFMCASHTQLEETSGQFLQTGLSFGHEVSVEECFSIESIDDLKYAEMRSKCQ